MLATRYNRPSSIPEKVGTVSKVEKVGYVPANRLIESMIAAGQRLQQYRADAYDFPADTDVDESFSDPTRKIGYDLAEGTQDLLSEIDDLRGKISTLEKKQRLEALEAAKKVSQKSNLGSLGSEAAPGKMDAILEK